MGPRKPRGPMGPSGPVAPSSPARPCGPAGPRGPAGPVAPSSPFAPAGPRGPAGPVAPSSPFAPAGPCGPAGRVAAGPVAPSAPFAPAGPCGPAGPVAPSSPFAPFAPLGPSGPAGPLGPSGPLGPCGPSGPGGPGGPCGPGQSHCCATATGVRATVRTSESNIAITSRARWPYRRFMRSTSCGAVQAPPDQHGALLHRAVSRQLSTGLLQSPVVLASRKWGDTPEVGTTERHRSGLGRQGPLATSGSHGCRPGHSRTLRVVLARPEATAGDACGQRGSPASAGRAQTVTRASSRRSWMVAATSAALPSMVAAACNLVL